MRLQFLLDRRPHRMPTPLLEDVARRLTLRGFTVGMVTPEDEPISLDGCTIDHDLYLLKAHSEIALSFASILHRRGARMLNPYPATAALCDKVVQAQILSDLAIPAPLTWTVGEIERFNTGCRPPPLVVKPTRGHDGRGVHILRSPDDISALPPSLGPVIVQEYIPGRGEDLKVYVVGEQVFGVRKRYTSSSFSRPGKPCTVPPDVCEIARRLGKALGIGLFGFDVIESARGPVVVDVNKFPGYRGVPGVAPVIARYIESYALGEIHEGSAHAYAATRA